MAEIIQKDGTWVFDGDALRLTPGRDKNVGLFRKELGELVVPLGALAGVSFEQGKKTGRLRLRLRDGADPLLHATGGLLGSSLREGAARPLLRSAGAVVAASGLFFVWRALA